MDKKDICMNNTLSDFKGKHYISRNDMKSQDEEAVMKAFDILCFKGNKHMKRGQGLRQFPLSIVYNIKQIVDLIGFINNMFKKRVLGFS